ncbi:hypothetical protein F2Q69_00023550 [Brassica cretica]|uniref:Uncharacterized protein n=1 Tax=Brassica cretica TaxID=69181 RepID=A0A8S9QMG2_BRACR|nr:hypothetical protein F2Q69_00023550 [Brassica cretica]
MAVSGYLELRLMVMTSLTTSWRAVAPATSSGELSLSFSLSFSLSLFKEVGDGGDNGDGGDGGDGGDDATFGLAPLCYTHLVDHSTETVISAKVELIQSRSSDDVERTQRERSRVWAQGLFEILRL